ncbi:lysophospholipid acyltransferase family protein [Nocardia bhagyanarayanae]|uniref:1-acyl-sn-glycerol-3-phosphate acyltransferase n=1 Tax=Nocardia bhagyanarayanae TaxID=1215925 RepID=A0A543F9P5_9NOCA|nr:lysophospholipid acyltransferase family protein [Nocardia bhagyanarayanae]TQM30552.1 1-acyl-sn-glycerol-3-phosphate acyltransferase [Nocardia bhagyanarayanae]
MWYRLFKHVLLGPLLRIIGRPEVVGLEHVPRSGPVIVAANHLAVIDSMYLALVLPRRVTFLAKQEYFTGTGWKGRFNRWFFSAAGQVPVDRTGGTAAADALAAATRILEAGGVWAIHPEGTRSPDGRVYRGRTGALRVAIATGAPVVPVVLSGTDRVNPRGSRMWRFAKVRVHFGAPRYYPPAETRADARCETDALMRELARRSGRQYVDSYAATFHGASVRDGLPHRRA